MIETPLQFEGPLPARPMLAALAAHSLAGVQVADVERGRVHRILDLDGEESLVQVQVSDEGVSLTLPAGVSPQRHELAVATVRRWLDLDLDPAVVRDCLGEDPILGPLVEARPGLRIVGHPDPFEAAVTTVLGQRVSLAAARVFGARFVEFFAAAESASHREGPDHTPPRLRTFPSAAQVAQADPGELQAAVGVTGARARCVVSLAAACAGGLDLAGGDPDETRALLLAVPGVGPWTVEYLAVRVMGDRDAFPSGDLVLQRALGVQSARDAELLAEQWHPWRAYGLFHLWTAQSYMAP